LQPNKGWAKKRGMNINLPARLQEIEERDRLRRSVGLPRLDRSYEYARLRNILRLERATAFGNWCRDNPELCERGEAKVLARARRKRGDPSWRPTGYLSGGGLDFGLRVQRLLRRVYRRGQQLGEYSGGGSSVTETSNGRYHRTQECNGGKK
jgi:hypothetical protein